MEEETSVKVGGNYRQRKENADEIDFHEFENIWSFIWLFNQLPHILLPWLIRHGLVSGERACYKENCTGYMGLCKSSGRPLGHTLRCNNNRDHECSVLKYSFFERSKLDIRDIFMFIKCYLEGNSLSMTARLSGVHYKSTALDWASFMRELFMDYFHRVIKNKVINGVVEIDESLFGRRVKYHKGDPSRGLRVWVFGLVDRATNTIILYPVRDRSEATLLLLIKRHVAPGSTIYSDGFSSYINLNKEGYNHFTVLHKYSFTKSYKNTKTNAIEVVHTNRIEGCWKHAKMYFRKMSGTQIHQWESHMAEVSIYCIHV